MSDVYRLYNVCWSFVLFTSSYIISECQNKMWHIHSCNLSVFILIYLVIFFNTAILTWCSLFSGKCNNVIFTRDSKTITFTCMHFADLHWINAFEVYSTYTFLSVHAFPVNQAHGPGIGNAMLEFQACNYKNTIPSPKYLMAIHNSLHFSMMANSNEFIKALYYKNLWMGWIRWNFWIL